MKNTKVGLVLVVAIVLIIGIIFLVKNNSRANFPNQTLVVNSTPTSMPTTKPISKYSAELKARVRGEFISNCQTKGHYSATECNCAADYLAKNYTEAELAKIYVQYRTSSQIPAALDAASKACTYK
jgi:hypothetical protein